MINIDNTTEFQVKRILAQISYANETIDDEERQLLTSSIVGVAHLSADEIATLIEDSKQRPTISDLVSQITSRDAVRYLIFNLTTLAIMKHDLVESEISAAYKAIDALTMNENDISHVRDTFANLLDLSKALALPTNT